MIIYNPHPEKAFEEKKTKMGKKSRIPTGKKRMASGEVPEVAEETLVTEN